jgi:hypothetical protein
MAAQTKAIANKNGENHLVTLWEKKQKHGHPLSGFKKSKSQKNA